MRPSNHVLRFRATLVGFEEAATALRELLKVRQVSDDARNNIEVVFEEAAANIIRHACPTGDVEVAIRFDDDAIVMTFDDDGVPFNPNLQPDPGLATTLDEAPIGGLGLVLIRKIARMAYERTPQQHNVLTLSIPARGSETSGAVTPEAKAETAR